MSTLFGPETRICSVCKKTLDITRFRLCKPKRKPAYREGRCRSCHNKAMESYRKKYYAKNIDKLHDYQKKYRLKNLDAVRSRSREWRKKYPEKQAHSKRKHLLKKNYGITPEQYDGMVAAQAGLCAICSRGPTKRINHGKLVIDHCHNSNRIRGLLCDTCNRALGLFKDDPAVLMAAARYVELHRPA